MIVSPAIPVSDVQHGVSSMRGVLAVICGDRDRDERTLHWACALADEHQARLTVLCLWSLPPMWPWVALSGAGAAVQMLELHRRELLRWIETRVREQTSEPVRLLSARHCDAPARVVGAELARGDYTCVVGSRRTIGRRAAQRFRRRRPGLTLVRV
jgi:hypothetical protein